MSNTAHIQVFSSSKVNYNFNFTTSATDSQFLSFNSSGGLITSEYKMTNNGNVTYGTDVDNIAFNFTGNTGNTFVEVKSINVSDITYLSFGLSHLEGIDVSKLVFLDRLELSSNNLTVLDISNNPLLTYLWVNNNSLFVGEIDNIYIQLDNNGLSNGTLILDSNRTSNSDTARANLISKGWTITD